MNFWLIVFSLFLICSNQKFWRAWPSGKALDCGSFIRGFKSRRSPYYCINFNILVRFYIIKLNLHILIPKGNLLGHKIFIPPANQFRPFHSYPLGLQKVFTPYPLAEWSFCTPKSLVAKPGAKLVPQRGND